MERIIKKFITGQGYIAMVTFIDRAEIQSIVADILKDEAPKNNAPCRGLMGYVIVPESKNMSAQMIQKAGKNRKFDIPVIYSKELCDFCLDNTQTGWVFGIHQEVIDIDKEKTESFEAEIERLSSQIKYTLENFRNRKKHPQIRRIKEKIKQFRDGKGDIDILKSINKAKLTRDIKEKLYFEALGLNKNNAEILYKDGEITGFIPLAKNVS